MKHVKLIFGLAFLLGLATGCSEKDGIDNDLSFLGTAGSGNTDVLFDISTDNSGIVKVTPVGQGVTSSMIDFGHGTGSDRTATVSPGGNAAHTYPEGTYTITIVSTDIAGKQTIKTHQLTVTYNAPTDVLPNKTASRNGGAVKPTAVGASSYRVDWGDGSPVVPFAFGGMENHIYAAPGSYNVKVTAISGNALFAGTATKDTTFPLVIAPPPAAPFALPVTFDNPAVNYFFGTFGGGQAFATVANPDPAGINTTASVGMFTRGWEGWSGTYSPLDLYMDLGTTKKIKLWAYNPDPALIGKMLNVELEAALGDVPGNGVGVRKVAFTTSGAWEELVFDFSTTGIPGNSKFGQLVFRFNDSFEGAGPGGVGAVIYIDNIRLTN